MPVPTNRNKILPARGNFSDLNSNKASLLDGEICYAIDQDQYYQKEGSVLVAVGATKAQGTKADTAVQPGANISVFTNNAGYLTNASLEISNADDVNITSIEEDQVLLWDGSDFVNGSAPVMVEVKNTTGSTISKGAAVYVSGTHTSGKPLISLADNNGSNTYPAIGLAHKDIANGDEGYVTVSGTLFNINTSFSGWSAGDALYLSDTPGALTNTRPTITAQKVQKVALVTRVHATAGSVIVIGAGRTNDIPNDLVTLTGVSLGDTTLGTFTGTTISDNESIKDALQTLETAVENASAPSNVLTTTTTFSGDVSGTYNNISIDDGPGSGLDADTVDGLQATSFLRANESDTFEGNGASGRKLTFRCIDGQTGADANGNKFPLEVFQDSNVAGSDAAMAFHIDGAYATYFGLDRATSDLFVGGWSKGANKYKIWHAGNDGAGTGLDADTLDGVQAASFLRSDASDTFNCNGNNLIFDFDTAGRASLQFSLNGTAQWNIAHTNSGADLNFDRVSGSGQLTIENSKVWYAGNDGAGTGLDADTLDGQQGSYYLDYNNFTNTPTIGSGSFDGLTDKTSGTGDYSTSGDLVSGRGSGGVALTVNDGGGNANVTFNHQDATPEQAGNAGRIRVNTDSTSGARFRFDLKSNVSSGSAVALTEVFNMTESGATCLGNTVWHAGSDGAGSGLDADTLDGINSGSFLRSDAADTTNSDLTISKNGSPTFTVRTSAGSGEDAKIKIGGARTSCNTCNISMLEFTNEVASPYTMAQISAMDPSDNSDSNNGKLVFRTSNGGTLQDRLVIPATTGDPSYNGNKLFHAGNDGAASGLDADTLDGVQGANFLRSDADDTFTGDITGETLLLGGGQIVSSSAKLQVNGFMRTGNIIIHEGGNSPTSNNKTISNISGDVYWDGEKIWRADNDGSSSGLDADTVDGLEASSFLRSNANDTATGQITLERNNASDTDYSLWIRQSATSARAQVRFTNGNTTQNGYFYYRHENSQSEDAQTSFHFDTDEDSVAVIIDETGTNAGFYVGTNEVWHAGNDGAGSGLDADTVDGVASTSFVRSDADDTANRRIVFSACATENHDDMATSTGSLGSLEIRNSDSGNDAFMAFHTSNDYAFYLGLDADSNSLAVGGWSLGNNKYKIWHAGNDGSGSGLDADTLDGVSSGNFLRSNANDSFSGAITGSGTILTTGTFMGITGNGGGVVLTTNDGGGNANLCFNHQNAQADQSGSSARIRASVDSTTAELELQVGDNVDPSNGTFGLTTGLKLTTSTAQFFGNTAWHAGNDGSGSGLDADTLDGIGSGSFLRSDATDSFNCNGFAMLFDFDDAGRNSIAFTLNGSTRWQFSHTNSGNDFNFDRVAGSGQVTIENSKVWYAGNDGDGSGLDADTLDGINSGGFLRSNDFDRKTSGSLRFNDDIHLQIGTDGDAKIYHNGTNTYIVNNTGTLFLQSNGGTQIKDSGGNEIHLKTVDNAQVELYYNNSKKLNTTAAGVEINSSIEIIHPSTPFIDFKNSSSDDFDSRILANPNALKFYTGGNGNTAEHFQIASNGDLTATDTTISQNSDSRLKTNVSDFTYSLEDFKQYQPKTFDWRNPDLHGNKTGQRGFIAQDVEAIDDYWVGDQEIDEDSADAQFLDEDRLVKTLKLGKKDAMYVSVIQQALAKIEALETTVSNLQARVTQLETT